MSVDLDLDLEQVREAYPDAGEPSPARLASLRATLLESIEESAPPERRRRRRRVPGPPRRRHLILGAVALALAAGVAVVLAGPGGSNARRPSMTEARAILRGAAAGLVVPAGAVLHTEYTTVETFSDRSGWTRSRDEVWQESAYPYDARVIEHDTFSFAHSSSQEYATVENALQLYDPHRNTIYPDPPLPFTARPAAQAGRYLLRPTHDPIAPTITITAAQLHALRDRRDTIIYDTRHHVSVVAFRSITHQQPLLISIRRTALALLRSGRARVLYDVRFAGRAAIEISGPGPIPAIPQESYYVVPRTYQPLGLVQRGAGKSGQTWTTNFTTYRLLPGTAPNRSLVTLAGAHPRALIDTNPSDYTAASSRLSK